MTEFDRSELRRIDGTLMMIFLALMRHRKASAVAQELAMTPSTVSHALQRLRDIFGDPLFLRRPHGLEPTAVAHELEPLLVRSVETLEQALRGPQPFDPGDSAAIVRIAAYDYEQLTILPTLVSRMLDRAPAMRIVTRPMGRKEARGALSSGDLDLAIGFYPALPGSFLVRDLYDEAFAVVSCPGASGSGVYPLDAYLNGKHVVVSPAGELSGVVDEMLSERGLSRDVVLSVPSFMTALAAVASADLVTTIPKRFAQAYAGLFGLEIREPPLPVRGFKVSAVRHRRDARNTKINWLEDEICAAARETCRFAPPP